MRLCRLSLPEGTFFRGAKDDLGEPMNAHWQPPRNPLPSRREMLRQSGAGFGALALAALLQEESRAAAAADPLVPQPAQYAARAKRVIFLFMHGGPSQVD